MNDYFVTYNLCTIVYICYTSIKEVKNNLSLWPLACFYKLMADLEGNQEVIDHKLSPYLFSAADEKFCHSLDVIPLLQSPHKALFIMMNHKQSASFQFPGKSELKSNEHA